MAIRSFILVLVLIAAANCGDGDESVDKSVDTICTLEESCTRQSEEQCAAQAPACVPVPDIDAFAKQYYDRCVDNTEKAESADIDRCAACVDGKSCDAIYVQVDSSGNPIPATCHQECVAVWLAD